VQRHALALFLCENHGEEEVLPMYGNQQPVYGNPYQMQYQQAQAPARSYYQPMAAIPQQTGLIQVTGMEGAKAYPLAPNSVAALFDADRDVMYIKRTDAGGYPTIQAYQFSPVQEAAPSAQPEYVTRQEFDELKEMIANGKQPVRKAKPAAESEE
jgi:type II secretory pathway predicted ATPase ExeA